MKPEIEKQRSMDGSNLSEPVPVGTIYRDAGRANTTRSRRIMIDGEFVGHALVGMLDITPVLVLPEGNHKLRFAMDGFDPVSADINVLGTNSKQYLLVKLPSEKAESSPPADAN